MDRKLFLQYLCAKKTVLVIFVTGTPCSFCEMIKPYVDSKRKDCAFLHIDRERDTDVYSLLLSKKQIKGVPSLLAYEPENYSVYANLSISGTNKNEIDAFFDSIDFI